VLLIMTNNVLMRHHIFSLPTTLTALHFFSTAVCTYCRSKWQQQHCTVSLPGYTQTSMAATAKQRPRDRDAVPTKQATTPVCRSLSSIEDASTRENVARNPPFVSFVLFATVSASAIVLSNTSLCINSVAFYQIMKLPTLLFVAALEVCTRVQSYDGDDVLAFIVILAGVAVTIHGQVSTNAVGFMVATASIITTGLHQFYCGRLQAWYGMSPSALLANVSPFKALALFVLGPPLDKLLFGSDIRTVEWNETVVALIALTCVLAIMLNVSQYTVIRLLGSGYYQALSQLKTVAIVLVGSYIFERKVSNLLLLGVVQAVAGVCLLASAKHRKNKTKNANVSMQCK